MALEITSIDTITATTARLVLGGGSSASGATYDIQVSPREDFQYCVAPMLNVAGGSTTVSLAGLNAGSVYYVRGRNRLTGSVEDFGAVNAFMTAAGSARVLTPATIMTEPAIIVTPIRLFDIEITNPVAGFPARNLTIDAPVAARSTGATTFTIYFRTSGEPIDTVALLQTNLPEAATIQIKAGTSLANLKAGTATASSAVTAFRASPNMPQRPGFHGLVRLGTPMTGPWFAVIIAAAPGAIKHVEHLIVGMNRATKNHGAEVSTTADAQTSIERRRTGIADRVLGLPMRRIEFELAALTEAQFEAQYADMWRKENEPIFVVPNSKQGSFLHDRMAFGDLIGGRVLQSGIRYTRGFSVRSII